MNCVNCGAAMGLAHSRHYLQCRYCGTIQFPLPVDADGVRILGVMPDAPACPVCKQGLSAAVLDNEHPVHFCGRCRGMLLPRQTFAVVISKRRAWATGAPAEPQPLDRSALERALACPTCSQPFETYSHYGPGNVVIDNCTRCDVIWLDFGEIRQIVDAPGSDRGIGSVPVMDDSAILKLGHDDEDHDDRLRGSPRDPIRFMLELLSGD